MTPKQVLAQHVSEHHGRLARTLPGRDPMKITFADLGRLHGRDHHRYGQDHWHGPQVNRGPGERPEGWATGTHMHLKEAQR